MTLPLSFSCFAFPVFGYMTCNVFMTVNVLTVSVWTEGGQ